MEATDIFISQQTLCSRYPTMYTILQVVPLPKIPGILKTTADAQLSSYMSNQLSIFFDIKIRKNHFTKLYLPMKLLNKSVGPDCFIER